MPVGAFGPSAVGAGLVDATAALSALALPPRVTITRAPLPFSRGFYIWSDPIYVDHAAGPDELEAARRRLEDELTRITIEADRLAGLPVIEAAPLAPPQEAPAS